MEAAWVQDIDGPAGLDCDSMPHDEIISPGQDEQSLERSEHRGTDSRARGSHASLDVGLSWFVTQDPIQCHTDIEKRLPVDSS